MRRLACLLALVLAPLGARAATPPLRFAWQPAGSVAAGWTLADGHSAAPATARPIAADEVTPLGSVWKLFVYGYLVDRQLPSDDYRCGDAAQLTSAARRHRHAEELYCCHAGGRIDREHALVQSCGLYFEPQRLHLDPIAWRDYWRAQHAPAWLQTLSNLRPDEHVSVPDLLAALRAVPPAARMQTAQTLVSVITLGRGQGTVGDYGSVLRAKTWTMPDPARPGASIGGAAGWLADGTPVWLSGPGSSNRVLAAAAPLLHPLLAQTRVPDDAACVAVDYFARYPIARVLPAQGDAAVPDGALQGRYRVAFANGQWLDIESHGELRLQHDSTGRPTIHGRLGINDYVARVVEREGDPREAAAAQALAVAARSYLVQQASLERGCWHIADDSRSQRVAPRPPGAAARFAADWTDTLVLLDTPVQYHRDRRGTARMSWQEAVALSRQGLPFDAILARSWPGATPTSFLSPLGGDCQPLAEAQAWIDDHAARWAQAMAGEAGYEPPAQVAVCVLREGRPYADARRERLYVTGLRSEEDRIALAHEYLHLAFAHHPRGQDEAFIEARARALLHPLTMTQGAYP